MEEIELKGMKERETSRKHRWYERLDRLFQGRSSSQSIPGKIDPQG
jgi:hypothetical protein